MQQLFQPFKMVVCHFWLMIDNMKTEPEDGKKLQDYKHFQHDKHICYCHFKNIFMKLSS